MTSGRGGIRVDALAFGETFSLNIQHSSHGIIAGEEKRYESGSIWQAQEIYALNQKRKKELLTKRIKTIF